MASVNTNYGALVALQNLTSTNKQLDEVQNRINTGLKVGSAKDNGAVFAIAEGLRLRSSALGSVRDGLDRATTSIDTALGAAESVGGILAQLKQKAVDAQTHRPRRVDSRDPVASTISPPSRAQRPWQRQPAIGSANVSIRESAIVLAAALST